MKRSMHRILAILPVLVCGAVTACDDEPTAPETSLTGTFALATIENQSLPFVLFELGDLKTEVMARSVTFNANGTFTASLTMRETDAGVVTTSVEQATGTYVRSGGSLTLTIPNDEDSPYQATLTSNTLSFAQSGVMFRFQRP
jgi:hypothetical protein